MDTLDISVLPEEVLEKIFSYLSVNDKRSVSLVSKRWLNVINQPKLLENFRVFVNIYNSTDIIDSILTRNFSGFIFCNLDITSEFIHFLQQHESHIRYLSFINCSCQLSIESECEELNICRNLKILEFRDNFLKIFHHLPCLKELYIEESGNNFIITDYVFYEFRETMPNLEKLVIHHPVASVVALIKRFYPRHKKWNQILSDLILTLPIIQDFVQERSKTLTYLSILNKEIQPQDALKLLNIDNLRLKCLYLNKWFECVNIIPEICRSQTSLIELDLSCLQVSDASIKLICSILPRLKAFKMQNNLLLDSSIVDIFQLKHLQILGLESCSNIRFENFSNALQVFQLHDLRSLDLASTKSDDKCVRSLLKLTPKLRYLNLSSCLDISDETVHTISENLILLRFLALSGCKNVTDQGLKSLHCPELCLSKIKGLMELHLRMCPKITTNGLLESIKFLELRSLNLQNNNYDLVDVMQQLKTQNPSLKFNSLYLIEYPSYIFCPSDFLEH